MNAVKPILHPRLFWDVNFHKIDYHAKASFVVERVFERGDVEDIRQVRRFYGEEKIISILTSAKWMRADIFVFVKNLFDLKPEQFRCYTQQQLSPIQYPF